MSKLIVGEKFLKISLVKKIFICQQVCVINQPANIERHPGSSGLTTIISTLLALSTMQGFSARPASAENMQQQTLPSETQGSKDKRHESEFEVNGDITQLGENFGGQLVTEASTIGIFQVMDLVYNRGAKFVSEPLVCINKRNWWMRGVLVVPSNFGGEGILRMPNDLSLPSQVPIRVPAESLSIIGNRGNVIGQDIFYTPPRFGAVITHQLGGRNEFYGVVASKNFEGNTRFFNAWVPETPFGIATGRFSLQKFELVDGEVRITEQQPTAIFPNCLEASSPILLETLDDTPNSKPFLTFLNRARVYNTLK